MRSAITFFAIGQQPSASKVTSAAVKGSSLLPALGSLFLLGGFGAPISAQVLSSEEPTRSEAGFPLSGVWGLNDSALLAQDALSPEAIVVRAQEALAANEVFAFDSHSLEGHAGTAYLVLPGFVGSSGIGPHGGTQRMQVPPLQAYEQVRTAIEQAELELRAAASALAESTGEPVPSSQNPQLRELTQAMDALQFGTGPTAAIAIKFNELEEGSLIEIAATDGGQFMGCQRGEGLDLHTTADGWIAFLYEYDSTLGIGRIHVNTPLHEGLHLDLWHGDLETAFAGVILTGEEADPQVRAQLAFEGLPEDMLRRHGIDPTSIPQVIDENPHLSQEELIEIIEDTSELGLPTLPSLPTLPKGRQ